MSQAEPAGPPEQQQDTNDRRPASAPERSGNNELKRMLKIKVPIIVRLARKRMLLSEVLHFKSGTIIEFDKHVGEGLDLMINNKCIGRGLAVKVGENFGLRITRITSRGETIKAMGG